ncbi:MAG: hypothetical protein ABIQ95_03445 [Bdellovibrionia bacterium]
MKLLFLLFLASVNFIPLKVRADYNSNYQQIISFSAGPIKPASASISKGTYAFNYDSGSTNSILLEVGGATRLFWLWGALYLNASLAFTRFNGSFSPETAISLPSISQNNIVDLSVNFFGLDTRVSHAWEWFPVTWLIPFIEAGYLYSLYSQFGSSDFDSVQGGTGNLVAAAGFRFWLNPSASVRSEDTLSYFSLPIFLSLKWNHIFPNGQPLDLGGSTLLFSASFGL